MDLSAGAAACSLLSAGAGFALGYFAGSRHGVPFVRRGKYSYAVGVLEGGWPDGLHEPSGVTNPVLTAAHVTDVTASFVADPFLVWHDGLWHMLFEVLNLASHRGEIAVATSTTGHEWTYRQVVLRERWHLSFPFVFQHEGQHYLLPEACEIGCLRLYRAVEFPWRWEPVDDILLGRYVDPVVFQHENAWWLLASIGSNVLHLFRADDPLGPWLEHPCSPLVDHDECAARMAGRVVQHEGRLYRLAQVCAPTYGLAVRRFEITELSADTYGERLCLPDPLLSGSGRGWNRAGMHHLDAVVAADGSTLAAVDGWHGRISFGWRY